jgi:mannose-6-phosphate isomerase-like protein (cupin superfamily)
MPIVSTRKRRIDLSAEDVHQFTQLLQEGAATLKAEQFDADVYLDRIIEKPWGWEYRVYADNFYDLWKLSLLPGQATSLHCHPRKETALLCLSGQGEMRSLSRTYPLASMDVLHIERGVFHMTKNIGETTLELVEVEAPRNKLDLIRAADTYGRQGKSYERQSFDFGTHAIQDGRLVLGSKLRKTCLDNRYRFGVRAGIDIIRNPEEHLLYLVSLGVMDVLSHDIRVFVEGEFEPEELIPENLYFSIGQNQ